MPENLVNKNLNHIFDVTEDDGQVTQIAIAYSGFITRIVKKRKDPMQTLFEIIYESVYNDDEESGDEQESDEEVTYGYALLQDYYEENLLIFS